MVRIDPRVYFLAAVLAMTIPIRWLIAAFTAAMLHEAGHLIAVYIFNGCLRSIYVGVAGTVIEVNVSHKGKEVISILAGPVVSLSLLCLCHIFPRLSLCAFAQGVFNLLPILPMDGGRIIFDILEEIVPHHAQSIMNCIEIIVLLLIFSLTVVIFLSSPVYKGIILCASVMITRCILRKRPCKQQKFKVQ